ncbi:MAG: hypothetical protein H0Z37_02320 [Firmicutes bacterium]|nr:hypothetical protein [Bacillota bacterium]
MALYVIPLGPWLRRLGPWVRTLFIAVVVLWALFQAYRWLRPAASPGQRLPWPIVVSGAVALWGRVSVASCRNPNGEEGGGERCGAVRA